MGPDIHSASVAAVIGVTSDHLRASSKQSVPEPGPTAKLGIQQGQAETNTPKQLVEGLLKRDLEKAKINVEKSKRRLKELEEKFKREKKNLTAHQTVVQYFTNLINGAKAGGGFIECPRKKYTGPPASVPQPTGTVSTAPTSLIMRNAQQSLENTHQSATVDEDMLSETGSTTLHSGALTDVVNPKMHSRSIDAAENENPMLTNYENVRPFQAVCSLPGYRKSWEEIKHRSSILCDDKTCSVGREECQNRWLETWARKEDELSQHLEIRENPRFGKELIWNGPVGKDPERLIAEYRGQLISTNELMARREKQDGGSITEGHFNFEVKSLGGPEHLWLDSTYRGSIARFANHNCDPNCIVIQFLDSNGPRLFLQSARRINPGDAITINYGPGVPPAYFRVTIGLKSQDVPVCYCGRDGCQWKITSAVRDMEIWLNKVPGDWSKDRKPGEPVPRTMNLYLPGARHTINVFEGDCDPANEEEILRIACGKVISQLRASLVKIMGGNGN
ncbi:SET domain-containing protein [Fusarium coicis]|nr:SET domain-containing protein [Fusarium coicis]